MTLHVSYLNLSGDYQVKQPLRNLPPFEALRWVRRQWAHRTQSHTPNLFYFSGVGKHVHCESYLESNILLHLDFLGQVRAILEQPFVLHEEKNSHIPDFTCRYADGSIALINVKPVVFLEKESNRAAFALADTAAQFFGWQHQVYSELGDQYLDNLKWLSAFRRIPVDFELHRGAVMNALEKPATLNEVVLKVGNPFIVKPIVFYLLWHRKLSTDLTQRFSMSMPLWVAREVTRA
jgi:hypothetical protein